MLNRIKLIGFSSFLLLTATALNAQDKVEHLLLQQAIDSALRNNKDIRLAQTDEKIAVSKLKETNAIFLPQVDFSFTALNSNNPLNVFSFKLQQQSVKETDFNPALLNHPDNASDFLSKLQLKQPIVNMDMLYMRKAAATQTDLYKLKTRRIKEYLSFEVTKAYMQLQLAYDAAGVLEEALKTANAMYAFTSNRVQEGLMQQSDALNVRVRVTSIETDLAGAKSNIQNASDYLSLLMGCSYGTVYTAEKTSMQDDKIESGETISADRADFAAMKKAIEASDLMIRSSKMSYLPRVNAFASYQLNDNRMMGFGSTSYLAGIQLSWDVFKGNSTKNKIATQMLERDKLTDQLNNQQEQSQLDFNKTKRQLADAKYRISQQNSAVSSAAEALRILQDRYEQGLVNSTDVLLAQTQLSQQKLQLAQAVFNQNITTAYLRFLTTTSNN